MIITNIEIINFRGHERTLLPLQQIGCLIGENNAGKSTVLHAIQFVLDEKKLTREDFYDPSKETSVTLRIEGVQPADVLRVGETHRARVAGMVRSGVLTIRRSQSVDAKPESKYIEFIPVNEELRSDFVNETLKGKRPGPPLRTLALGHWPALDEELSASPTTTEVKEAVSRLRANLSEEELRAVAAPYPTGLATALRPLLPTVIYVEAVKDVTSEAKASGSSTFSKLLEVLFSAVESDFKDIERDFRGVHGKLSRTTDDAGELKDDRLEAVKQIEATLEECVQSSFPGVGLRMNIPAPTLSLLLASAQLVVDDGHESSVASKGDGLKRAILFALLRAYATIRSTWAQTKTQPSPGAHEQADPPPPEPAQSPYILLFEEPELYLHPSAQRQLMAALVAFSESHQVLVTTHSPAFFQPGTKGFSRLQKTAGTVRAIPIDLTLSNRDAYQLVQYENNEAAFFAHRIVLVEGDSDRLIFPHLARLMSSAWDSVERNIMFVRMGGKGNVGRYRRFFTECGIPVYTILDLDVITDGFSGISANADVADKHARLMSLVEDELDRSIPPKSKKIKSRLKSHSAAALWSSLQAASAQWKESRSEADAIAVDSALKDLFSLCDSEARVAVLQNPTDEIQTLTDDIIASLREERVFVLRRGDLEDYCGSQAATRKVDEAIVFCNSCPTLETYTAAVGEESSGILEELEVIFSCVYDADVAVEALVGDEHPMILSPMKTR